MPTLTIAKIKCVICGSRHDFFHCLLYLRNMAHDLTPEHIKAVRRASAYTAKRMKTNK
jgi:hypothetical protein